MRGGWPWGQNPARLQGKPILKDALLPLWAPPLCLHSPGYDVMAQAEWPSWNLGSPWVLELGTDSWHPV